MAEPTYTALTFDQLEGWRDDNHQAAFDVFKTTCGDMDVAEWAVLADIARTNPAPRDFFEEFFSPVLITDGAPMLFTGYFEPELDGSREAGGSYSYPIYAVPDTPGFSRREIEEGQVLVDRGLELAWLTDPVDAFFLQVQGSGRIRLPDGGIMRVGFGGKNGRPYTSIGKVLVARGVLGPDEVSASAIRDWVRQNGDAGRALLWENESYVFFREVSEVPADQGPLGAMNRSITAGRSIAVDPAFVPLGAPVWIEKEGTEPMQRLMIAQDIGGAIKGAQRADIFFGTGAEAGEKSGQIKDSGRIVVLMPIPVAQQLVAG
ncbi:murein transglycosylase A [Yoonia algicola]|uniref:peptidoglycan lytic exotransglycosylase n=1 Tax=Yoonia algicola TaxID=3137368 RepID=A0AAN0M0T1_9RHOB